MDLRLCWEAEHRLVLTCRGELGWDSTELLIAQVKKSLEGRTEPQVIINLDQVDCITSAGIGGLLQLRKLIVDCAGSMVVACASPMIVRLFKTVGLDRHLPMLDTLKQAHSLLSDAGAPPVACDAVGI